MTLSLVDPFAIPYEKWDARPATLEEMVANGGVARIQTTLLANITDASAAADYMAGVGSDNGLGNHVATALKESSPYRSWQAAMPATPPAIARYQKDYANSDFVAVSQEIDRHGYVLSAGQCLFHGGLWPGVANLVTDRPLSTSLCPQVAFKNAEFKAKAYDARRLDLLLLRVIEPRTKAFIFKLKGTKLGHESEVLLATGATLTLKAERCIRSNYKVGKWEHPDIEIPVYVMEVEVS